MASITKLINKNRVGFLPGGRKGLFRKKLEETGRNWKKWKIWKKLEELARMLA